MNAIARRRCFIAGRFVDSGTPFDVFDPVTGQIVAHALEADEAMVDAAVQAARAALAGEWARLPLADRRALLYAIADGIDRRRDDFLAAEIADTGKPLAVASAIDIPRGAANFRIFADAVASAPTECFETATPDGRGALNYALRRPLGVVAVVCPWNLPLLLMTWKVAPALACGNAVVVKPSEETPSSATLLAEVVAEAGLPEGVFNLVHGFGPGSAGEHLTTHPDIDGITFTGETATGGAIARAAAPGIKPVSFELGGKNPALVFADADLDDAVAGLARAAFANTGQVCLAPERIYVERTVFDRFVDGLARQAKDWIPGDPYADGTTLGPLISAAHRDKVLDYFALAKEEGAEVVCGGGVPRFGDARDGGYFVEPTVWTGLAQDARCVREEIFGPVTHVMPFDDEDEAIALANDTPYGLAATVWTRDLARAHRTARRIEAGICWVNCWYLRDLRTPFGGMKMSGIGREGGAHSLEFYSELTNVCIKL